MTRTFFVSVFLFLTAAVASGCKSTANKCEPDTVRVTLPCGPETIERYMVEVSRSDGSFRSVGDTASTCPHTILTLELANYAAGEVVTVRATAIDEKGAAIGVVSSSVTLATGCSVLDLSGMGSLDAGTDVIVGSPAPMTDAQAEGCAQDGGCSVELCDGSVCSSACTPGIVECSSDRKKRSCVSTGQWQEDQCEFACVAGVCAGDCIPDSGRCNPSGAALQVCSKAGTWSDVAACTSGCQGNSCNGCTPNATICTGSTQRSVCKDDGSGFVKDDCAEPKICGGGKCICPPVPAVCQGAGVYCSAAGDATVTCGQSNGCLLQIATSLCPGIANGKGTCSSGSCSKACNDGFTKCSDGTCRKECPGFMGLGIPAGATESLALDTNADGSVIVGTGRGSALIGFLWTRYGGLSVLAKLSGTISTVPLAVSGDGSVIVGAMGRATSGSSPVIWKNGTPSWLLPDSGEATGVSADGKVVVGHIGTGSTTYVFRKVSTDEPQLIVETRSARVSADGLTVVGSGSPMSFGPFRWTASTGPLKVGEPHHEPEAVNGAGTLIAVNDSNGGPYLLDTRTGVKSALPAPTASTWGVSDIDQEGRIVVGNAAPVSGSPGSGAVWTAQSGTRYLSDLGVDTKGWIRLTIFAVSLDGTVVVGYGTNPQNQQEAFRCVLP